MEIKVEFDVPATMRDGTVLRANIFRPADGGTYPVAVTRTPYAKDMGTVSGYVDAVRLAREGYIVVIQDTRGRLKSEGEWVPYKFDGQDGYDTVEWAAGLPGSSGAVGMFGPSYVGFTQWITAAQKPPHLKAIFPGVTWADYRDGLAWRDGAFELGKIARWHLSMSMDVLNKRLQDLAPEDRRAKMLELVHEIDHLDSEGYYTLPLNEFTPLKRLDLINEGFQVAFTRPYDPDFTDQYSPQSYYDAIDIPAYNVGGWYDIFCAGTLNAFTALRHTNNKLLMGPWSHSGPNQVTGQMDFGFLAGGWINMEYDLTTLTRRWFDYWLKGIDNGILEEPPVKLFIMGENVWRDENEWPLARTQYAPWYLHGDGVLAPEKPATDAAPDRYVYDPADPTPTWGGSLLLHPSYVSGVADQRKLDDRDDILRFTSLPLEQDMEVTGPVSVLLWASSDARDTDFVARLIDVHPDGFAQNLCDGIIRARYRGGDIPELLEPGQVYQFTIDLWSTANLFKAGHRIRLDIASASFPRWDRNPNTGDDFGASTAMQPAQQTIFHDAARPSQVILPIIPR